MAKRYARLNWQDSPSVATPVSAANLNKMDKGIDDIDNAVETLNDNLVLKSKTFSMTANATALTYLDVDITDLVPAGYTVISAHLISLTNSRDVVQLSCYSLTNVMITLQAQNFYSSALPFTGTIYIVCARSGLITA